MTALEERLKELTEIEAKIEAITAYNAKKEAIEEKKERIEKLKDELETQNDLVATVDPDLLDMMSQSASRSRERRGGNETVDIDESFTRLRKRLQRSIKR